MKYLYLLAFALLSSQISLAQCTQAVGNNVYTQNYGIIAGQVNDQLKLDKGVEFTSQNCVTSAQVKSVAMLFNSEAFRYDFCVLSYHSVVDKSEFYMVYDAFSSFSYVFRLHDFVLEQRAWEEQNGDNNNNNNNNQPVELVFPNWNYPNYTGYNGPTGCSPPIPDNELTSIGNDVIAYQSDQEKSVAAAVAVQNNCLSMAQFMKLASLIEKETLRLQFMKSYVAYVYDQGNYAAASQCFNHQPYQQDWLAYCDNLFQPAEPEVICDVDEAKFKGLLQQIDDENFADDQLAKLKMINNDHCFSTAQVKRIMEIFSFPENKLDAVEMLYPKCTDRENYHQLKGSFSFPSYEADFEDMINGN